MKAGTRYNDWRLVELLGKGGNGVVWRVQPDGAMKFLKPHFYRGKRYERFKDEVEALKQCEDVEGVLPLLDYSLPAAPKKQDPPWLVMGLAEPLSDINIDSTQLAVEICASVAKTMTLLHARRIEHRDIKPANLFRYNGTWAIGDFGLANYPSKEAITGEGEKLGPVYYIAPEMLNDAKGADGKAADVYSLSKTLWVLATGHKYPLPGEHRIDQDVYRITTHVSDPRAYSLDPLLESSTRFNPQQRISMSDFARGLEAWLEPPATPAQGDVSDLRGYVQGLLGVALTKEKRYEQAVQRGKAVFKALSPHFRQLEEKLKEVGLVVTSSSWNRSGSSNGIILQLSPPECRVDPDHYMWEHGDAFIVRIRDIKDYRTFETESQRMLWCGAGMEIATTEHATLAVGYAASVNDEPQVLLWGDCARFVLGGPEEESVISTLVSGINENLRPAVKRFLDLDF